jgi:hypothetical protein
MFIAALKFNDTTHLNFAAIVLHCTRTSTHTIVYPLPPTHGCTLPAAAAAAAATAAITKTATIAAAAMQDECPPGRSLFNHRR